MNHIFKNNQFQSNFNKNGYIITPFLDDKRIHELKKLYNNIELLNNKNNCLSSNAILLKEENLILSNKISDICLSSLQNIFTDFTLHGGGFSTKMKKHQELPLHQDTTIIDDSTDTHYAIWIPLIDVNEDNGSMFVIPGSHQFYRNYISYTLDSCLIDRQLIPSKYIQKLDMKAGEALIFSHRLLHGSFANKYSNHRIAVTLSVTNTKAKLVYYNKKSNSIISKYQIYPENYLNSYEEYSKGNTPDKAIFIEDIKYSHILVNEKIIYKSLTNKDYPYYYYIFYYLTKFFKKIIDVK